jgi:uncharacterized protein YcbX
VSARVHSLISYPVKGCAGVRVERTSVTPLGVEHDRTFVVVGQDDVFRSQRRNPVMAAIRPQVREDGARLRLSAPGVEDVVLDVVLDQPRRRVVSVWKYTGEAIDQGDTAAGWFSTVLGAPCRLVRVPPEHARVSTGETPGKVGFADGQALLVTSLASLDELNSRILDRGGDPVPMDRFRPNLVVSGWQEPHSEDRVRRMVAGRVELGYAKVCVRCMVPMIDQETGAKVGPEPVRTLATYRRALEGGVTFGMKAAVLDTGDVSVGDPVEVLRWSG